MMKNLLVLVVSSVFLTTVLAVTAQPSEPVSINQISLYAPSDVPALPDLSAEAY
jgi:hypothetical protein